MRSACKEAIDIAVDYLEDVEKFKPFPKIQPGFLVSQLPPDPPLEPVSMEAIFKDVDRILMPSVSFLKWFDKLKCECCRVINPISKSQG